MRRRLFLLLATGLALAPQLVLAAEDAVEEEVAGLPQLDATKWPAQLFWLAIVFVATYLLLWRVVIPALAGVLEQRKTKIAGDLDLAASAQTEAETQKAAYEHLLAEAENQARRVREEAQTRLEVFIKGRRAEFDEAARTQAAGAAQRIAEARARALSDMTDIAKEATAAAITRLAGAPAQPDEVAAAVAQATGRTA